MKFLGIALALSALVAAQTPEFAPPVKMKAGGKVLGEGRPYPSPVFHDFDGDGRLDVVVGDLAGRLTVAHGQADRSLGAEEKVKAADGEILNFHNW
jgi:hypothetical protein